MKLINSTFAVIALATSGAALAADFDSLDVDGNGAISMQEAAADAKIAEQFNTLDVDGNGELSKEEFSKAQ